MKPNVPSAGKSITILDFQILEYINPRHRPKPPDTKIVPANSVLGMRLFFALFCQGGAIKQSGVGGKYYNILPLCKIKLAKTVGQVIMSLIQTYGPSPMN